LNFTHLMFPKQSQNQQINMEKYLKSIILKIQQLTEIAKEKYENPYLENEYSITEEDELDDVLDRLHRYHGRKQMIEKYLT